MDAQNRSVPLPGKPGMALRITGGGGGSAKTDANDFIDPNLPSNKSSTQH